MVDLNSILTFLSIAAIPLLLAITLHEAAHAFAAKRLGDATSWMLGRVTLNPFKHIDPIGTVLLPLMLIMFKSPVVFGYAKPVPVNFNNLRDSRWSPMAVALAGPAANVVLILISVALLYTVGYLPQSVAPWFANMLVFSLQINAILIVFNLLPILPLDGGRVVAAALPGPLSYTFGRTERYGMFIILALLFIPYGNGNLMSVILLPPMELIFQLISLIAPRVILG